MASSCSSVLSDRNVLNWFKVGLAVKYTRDGLKDIAECEVTEFSGQMYDEVRTQQQILSTTTCNNCSNISLLAKKKIKCSIHLCDNVRDKIISAHRRNHPNWKNTDVSKWGSSNWEIAKCFMPDGYKFRNTVEETDFNGIINILITLKRFDNKMAADLSNRSNVLTEAKVVANKFRHNVHCKFSDTEFNDCIKNLSNVLKDPKYIAKDGKAQNALKNVEQLCSEEWKINVIDMKTVLQDIAVDIDQEKNEERRRILEDIKQSIDSGHRALDSHIQRGIKRIRKESDSQTKRLKQATIGDYTARKNDLRKKLINDINEGCRTVSISPFLEEEETHLLSFYVTPVMQLREHQFAKDESQVESYKDIFAKGGIRYKHIYITGEAGVGKTTLCRRMALLWALSKGSKLQDCHARDENDMLIMKYFDFLFYANLRETTLCRIEEIIHQQLFDDESDKNFLRQVLKKEKCLIILDGLHEWSHSTTCNVFQKYKVPHCHAYGKCTFVTISRPYRLESLRLKSSEIDREVVITGMYIDSQISFVRHVVRRLDNRKDPYKFLQDVDMYNMTDLLEIPITAAHLVCLWIDNKLGNFTRSHLSGTILENMFNRAINRQLPHHDPNVQERLRNPVQEERIKYIIPECLTEFKHMQEHMSTLSKLFHLAFDSLFSLGDKSVSYSNTDLEKYELTKEDVELLCLVGLFSKRKAIGYLTERRYKISFLHTFYQEYMAALYMYIAMKKKDIQNIQEKIKQVCNTYANMKRFANVFVVLAAIAPELLEKLFVHIDEAISTDESAIAFREHSCSNMFLFISHRKQQINYDIEAFQDTVIKCCEASASQGIALKIRDIFIYKNNIKQISCLLTSSWKCIKSVFISTWHSELKHKLAKLNDLQKMEIRYIDSEFHEIVDLMINSKTVLQNLFVSYCVITRCIPFEELSCLQSLYLHNVKMQHNHLTELLRYMSSGLRLSQIGLDDVKCIEHVDSCRIGRLDLSRHPKMNLLGLSDVRVSRVSVNTAKLERLRLDCKNHCNVIWMQPFVTSLMNAPFLKKVVIHSVKDPKLVGHLVQTLASLKSLRFMHLLDIHFYNNKLELHKDVKDIEVEISHFKISEQGFERFLDSIGECGGMICVHLQFWTIGAPSDDEKKVANIIKKRKHLRIHRLTDVSIKFCNDGRQRKKSAI